MNCKFCNAELERGSTVCTECGRDNTKEVEKIVVETPEVPAEQPAPEPVAAPKKKNNVLLIILAAIGALALAAVLVGAILYGVKNNPKNADTYVVSEKKAISAHFSSTITSKSSLPSLSMAEVFIISAIFLPATAWPSI